MIIVVGLGNPGVEYQNTRHNTGQLLVDRIFNLKFEIFKDAYGWRRKKDIMVAEYPDLVLVKTAGVFMNESGRMVREALGNRQWALENLYITHDDLDITLGEYKIQFGKGPKEHNGLLSVEQALGTKEFWRVRIGVDNRPHFAEASRGEEYVLQRFLPEEKEVINRVIERAVNEILEKDI